MRLTKLAKEAFVRAVMQDVPKVDNRDKIQKILNDATRKSAHKGVNEMYLKHPGLFKTGWVWIDIDRNKLESHIYDVFRSARYDLPAHQSLIDTGYSLKNLEEKKILSEAQSQALVELLTEERKSLKTAFELEQKLESVIQGCNTLKQLKEALPEFEKYMPSEKGTAQQEPACACQCGGGFYGGGLAERQGRGNK